MLTIFFSQYYLFSNLIQKILKSKTELFLIFLLSLASLVSFAQTDAPIYEIPFGIEGTVSLDCSKSAELAQKRRSDLPANPKPADFIFVDKSRRLLHLMRQGQILKTYRVALGRTPVGKKRQEGDNKTPEGLYSIGYKNSASDYHLSLAISYPNNEDLDWARKNGVSAGGDIMIHGLPNSAFKRAFINHPSQDWTRGCVAVTNGEIEEIWNLVAPQTFIGLCP